MSSTVVLTFMNIDDEMKDHRLLRILNTDPTVPTVPTTFNHSDSLHKTLLKRHLFRRLGRPFSLIVFPLPKASRPKMKD